MTGADRPDAGTGRVLGIDLGERRIGIAVGDPGTGTASPFATIGRSKTIDADAAAIVRIASEQGASGLVVGLPLDMDGTEGAQAARTREWAAELARKSGLPVALHDERLTSERAERRIGGPPRGRNGGPPTAAQRDAHRARIDREAAALILQDAFDSRALCGRMPDAAENDMTMPNRPRPPEPRAGLPPVAQELDAFPGGYDRSEQRADEVESR